MRGIVSAAGHVPHHRLDRGTIRAVAGTGGGRGHRAVASADEDASTMAVEAARLARRQAPHVEPDLLVNATVAPPYLDKTNATVVHAALRLRASVGAWDAGGSVRSAVGALRLALERDGTTLVTAADVRTGLPGGAEESAGGDAGAALLTGSHDVVAEYLGGATVADEFIDRWRVPGRAWSQTWEERFGELRYLDAALGAWEALDVGALGVERVDRLVLAGSHPRAVRAAAKRLADVAPVAEDLADTVGNPGAAQPALLLTAALEAAEPDQVIALVVLADGADVLLFRTTDLLAEREPARSIAAQVAEGAEVAYGRFLAWRGMLDPEPPRRPAPARISAPAAARSSGWKHGFVGATGPDGAVELPPQARSEPEGAAEAHPMADARGRVATFTVDRMAWSPSPPTVFAVVDFDDGGRLPLELTDVDESEVEIGTPVEMVFRRLGGADGIHNYFWKARPVRAGEG